MFQFGGLFFQPFPGFRKARKEGKKKNEKVKVFFLGQFKIKFFKKLLLSTPKSLDFCSPMHE
jgi:hypothetical protein